MLPKKKELFCIELKNQHILEDKKKVIVSMNELLINNKMAVDF